ncbi:hypothetical protein SEUCBS139899_010269 [Sporothrix eucalyptigena]|uniref:Secretory lipase n=1 Tax=Sporothrix eucalyptigena TaxID=1812306 RepID=A0ABP0CUM3_9PEZI
MRLALVLAVLSAVSWASRCTPGRSTTPPLPSTDAFYDVPANISSYAPGDIIKYRPPPNPIAAFGVDVVNVAATWQIQYRTTDNLGGATATVLTVLIPSNADLTKILSYQIAEDAPNINCAPSYVLQLGAYPNGANGTISSEEELLLVEAALYEGWVVVLPDHEGPWGAYLANRLAGQATLDGIRAARQSTAFTGIASAAKAGLWGYSGGALATAWAAVLQPSYAPDLTGVLVGAAFGGTVPNLYNTIETVNGTAQAGLIVAGVVGLAAQYSDIKNGLEAHVLPAYRAGFEAVATSQCLGVTIDDYSDADVLDMVDDTSLWTNTVTTDVFNNNSLQYAPKAPAGVPLFVYKAVQDEVSPVTDTDDLVAAWCSAGASVEYVRDATASHSTLAVTGAPMALAWLISLAEGTVTAGACSTTTKESMLLDEASLEVVPSFLIDAITALLTGSVGT